MCPDFSRGTLFLDEVGLLPQRLQSKLLKAVEEREIRRLGSIRSEAVDVWIVTATSEDLATARHERRFHEALYHRLSVLTLYCPPLRERGRDILLLAEHFLSSACADHALPPKDFTPDAHTALLAYRWPGNVRELANVMERVALLSEELAVTAEILGLPPALSPGGGQALLGAPHLRDGRDRKEEMPLLKNAVGNTERGHLLGALTHTLWNISHAAKRLGISRNTLRYRIDKYGLRSGVAPQPRSQQPERPAVPAVTVEVPPPSSPSTALRYAQDERE